MPIAKQKLYSTFFILAYLFVAPFCLAGLHDDQDIQPYEAAPSRVPVHPVASASYTSNDQYNETGCCGKCSRKSQDCCYQCLVPCWGPIVAGFEPGRREAFRLLDIQDTDMVLLDGEGDGLDFAQFPSSFNLNNLHALDFSSKMVKKAKERGRILGIPDQNIVQGDAQEIPYTTERFDKIFFPLSLASIPNPSLALQEAERVLAPQGKIIIMEKLVDEGQKVTCGRRFLNFFTKRIFADIIRDLPTMMYGQPLKLTHYTSLNGLLKGCWSCIGKHYKLAVLVRDADYPSVPAVPAN